MRLALATVATLTVTATPALAFQPMLAANGNPICWHETRVSLVLDSEGTSVFSQESAEQAVVSAIRAWDQVPGTDLRLDYAGQLVVDNVGYSAEGNVHAVQFFDNDWPFTAGTLAVTLSAWETSTGRLVDADIAVNTAEFAWSTDGAAGRYDLASALTHEMGHLVGLSHALDVDGATMYPSMPTGDTSKRDLHADDVAGYRYLYGNGEELVAPTDGFAGGSPQLGQSSPTPGVADDPADQAGPSGTNGRDSVAAAATGMGCTVARSGADMSPVLLALFGLVVVTGLRRRG